MSNLMTSITISFIAMSVIFITLITLILVIKVLVAWWPYKAPPSPTADSQLHEKSPNQEHLAAIHAALTQYLGKTTDEIQLHNIRQL